MAEKMQGMGVTCILELCLDIADMVQKWQKIQTMAADIICGISNAKDGYWVKTIRKE